MSRLFSQIWVERILAVTALVFLVKAAKPVLVPVGLAMMLALVLAGPVQYLLRRWHVPVQVGATLALASFIGIIILIGIILLPPAKELVAGGVDSLQAFSNLIERLRGSIPWLAPPTSVSGRPLANAVDPLREKLASQGLDVTGSLLAHGGAILFTGVATIILCFILLISERWLVAETISLLRTRRQRACVLGVLRESQQEIHHFFLTMGMINVGLAVAVIIVMEAIGLPNAEFWGGVAGVLNFIPYFGPMLITLLFVLAGASSFDTVPMMLAPAVGFIFVAALESNIFSPWIVGRRLRLNPLAIFFLVLILGWLWGVVGAFLAVPFLIVLRAVARRRRSKTLFIFLARHGEAPHTLGGLLNAAREDREWLQAMERRDALPRP